jgi:signal transduction histidine kinase
VAQRVFGELSAAGGRSDRTGGPASDDLMVWIREVIDQDVNLFQGADLVATSQRDLFDNGLLPTRTPASAYRQIAFDQLPTCVVPDRLGAFEYLVAAAPVAGAGRDALISVPVALRQRDIERQVNELERGVLAGAVLVVLFAAGLGASVAGRIADPVARLTRATRQIAAGQLDVNITADTADELRTLVDDFNTMTRTLRVQRDELARTNQLKAWHEMARQVAHEIKNPLTPIQLVAEHLQRVHEDRGRPLGEVFDQCVGTILRQVRLLRQIASEFSTFASEPKPRIESVSLDALLTSILEPYRLGRATALTVSVAVSPDLPPVAADRTLLTRALTNLVENAVQAMPTGGTLSAAAVALDHRVRLRLSDTGVGMDGEALARAFEPYFSTKTGGSGLGLANARRNIELIGGSIAIDSVINGGTTVTIDLPSAGRPDASASASTPSPRTPTGDSNTPESPA